MSIYTLYSPELWKRFCNKFGTSAEDFELKKYPQFDPYFNFVRDSAKIEKLVSDPKLKKVAEHPFAPFVKILTKTPRYRWQENEKEYGLETKIRPIAFASHFDTYLYSFYSFALTEKYQDYIKEYGFDECILAYRTDLKGKCNIQFSKEVFDKIEAKVNVKKSCSVIALDITGYFDNINHNILKEKWCAIIKLPTLPEDQYRVFRSLTNYSYVNKDSFLKHFNVNLEQKRKRKEKWQSLLDLIPDGIAGSSFNEKFNLIRKRGLVATNMQTESEDLSRDHYKGIPQGSAMSALLSNVYLIDFDKWLCDLSKKMDFTYRRYCDDLIVVCNTEDEVFLNGEIRRKITEYKVIIKKEKTELLQFATNSKGKLRSFDKNEFMKIGARIKASNEHRYYKNLQYLGFEFNGQKIYIRPGSLSRYFKKAKKRISKTVMMAYSAKSKVNQINKKQIYFRYTHTGPRNFISYARNAAMPSYKNRDGLIMEAMNSKAIKAQIASHIRIIKDEIRMNSLKRYQDKETIRAVKKARGKRVKHIPLKL